MFSEKHLTLVKDRMMEVYLKKRELTIEAKSSSVSDRVVE